MREINHELKAKYMEHPWLDILFDSMGVPKENREESKSNFCNLAALIEEWELEKEAKDPTYKQERINRVREFCKEYGFKDPYEEMEQFEKEQAERQAFYKEMELKIRKKDAQNQRKVTIEDILFEG